MVKNGLGERCKRFELAEVGRRAMPGLPLLARLDGRAFHTFTQGMARPYEEGLSIAMRETARYLVQEMHARVGYTQSDEITLAWFEPSHSQSEYVFDGRLQKIASILAGMASARFVQLILQHLPGKAGETPHFDCRVWQVPTLQDAVDVFVWREDDATKNSINMAARAYYDERELVGRRSSDKQEMLWQKGVNWNDYPRFFKRGSYFQRRAADRFLSDEVRARIPEAHRPSADTVVRRAEVVELDLPPVRRVSNLAAVLFERAAPEGRP